LLDTTRTFGTPEQAAYTYRIAGPFVRGLAYLLDIALLTLCLTAAAALLLLGSAVLTDGDFSPFNIAAGLFLVLYFLLVWLGLGTLEYLWRGQTPGKKALGIRTITEEGLPASYGACLLRTLLRYADAIPTIALGLTVMICGRDFRRLGDWAAGTLVVYEANERRLSSKKATKLKHDLSPEACREIAATVPAELFSSLDSRTAQSIANYASRRAVLGKSRSNEIAAHLTDALRTRYDLPKNIEADQLLQAVYFHLYIEEETLTLSNDRARAFVAARKDDWEKLAAMSNHKIGGGKIGQRRQPVQFAALYRAAATDLALAESLHLPDRITNHLHHLIGQAHLTYYPRKLPKLSTACRYIFQQVPGQLYGDNALRISVIAFFGIFILCICLAILQPDVVPATVGADTLGHMRDMYADHPSGREADEAIACRVFTLTTMSALA
jgi:uncharacterized RDD family membrane protein YckC